MDTETLDKKYFTRSESLMELVRSEGSYLVDEQGKKYIDFLMGWCVGNLGWGNKTIEKAIEHSRKVDYVYPNFLYKPWVELAELLADITPGKLQKSYRTTGGTESVEVAMQLAMCYTKRHKFISIEGSYHGNSIAALSIGSSENRKQFKNLLPNCYKINPPLNKKTLEKVETKLKKCDVAAFIMEPIICSLGILVPEKEFMTGLQELCNKYGTLLVMDEVATGFGRTGKLFATEHFGIEPDIMCLSKAMTGGYAGLGTTITTEKIAEAVEGEFSVYSTYGWHPVSVDAAIANIRYILDNKEELFTNIWEINDFFTKQILQMKFKTSAELNIQGLAIAINLGDTEYADKIKKKCLEKGLILTTSDDKILMFPALNIEKEVAKKGLDILEQCI
ncbi:MAG: class-III pyridoxal-phosphate-dependent aminotransferase [Bacteroidota bacterium]